jgi:peptidoglycan/xylan/chitin deacetylase (PgdA/CDA1 family)
VRILILLAMLALTGAATAQSDETGRRIALSFDDAPRGDGPVLSGEERTGALLAALEAAGVDTAVFFVTTRGLEDAAGRERIRRYAEAGHLIANHTHRHRWLSRTDPDEYIADIDRAAALLEGYPNRRDWFRFPFLDEGNTLERRDGLREALEARGLFNGYVTVDNYDWHIDRRWRAAAEAGRTVDREALSAVYVEVLMGAVEFYDAAAVEALGRSPAHVLLLHENDMAAHFIGDLAAALRADGWTIISPDEAYADPMASILPQTLMTRQGHVAALAVEAGRDPRTLDHMAIDEARIDALLEERGVFGPPD